MGLVRVSLVSMEHWGLRMSLSKALRSLPFPEGLLDPLTWSIISLAPMTLLAIRTAPPRFLVDRESSLRALSCRSPLEGLSFMCCFVLGFQLHEPSLIGFALLFLLGFFLISDLAVGIQTRRYEKRCHSMRTGYCRCGHVSGKTLELVQKSMMQTLHCGQICQALAHLRPIFERLA